jgi:hypothetical protein
MRHLAWVLAGVALLLAAGCIGDEGIPAEPTANDTNPANASGESSSPAVNRTVANETLTWSEVRAGPGPVPDVHDATGANCVVVHATENATLERATVTVRWEPADVATGSDLLLRVSNNGLQQVVERQLDEQDAGQNVTVEVANWDLSGEGLFDFVVTLTAPSQPYAAHEHRAQVSVDLRHTGGVEDASPGKCL